MGRGMGARPMTKPPFGLLTGAAEPIGTSTRSTGGRTTGEVLRNAMTCALVLQM